MKNQASKRTLWTRLADYSFRVGSLVPSVRWRLFWECQLSGYFYSKIRQPFYNGHHWTDRSQ